MTLIQEVSDEALEIILHITAYVRAGGMTWAAGEELKRQVLNDTADALGLPMLQALLAELS